jgi:large repetitive protein
MSNGRYLLTGGTTCANDTATTGWKTINPLAGAAATVTSGGAGLMGTNPLALARSWHTATKLTGDVVLLAGGRDALVPTTTLELVQYNAANESVTSFAIASPLLSQARFGHTATRFPAGCVNTCKVLLAGGTGATRFADVYSEPSAGLPTGSLSTSTGQMSTARTFASAALLTPGGVVLIAGGSDGVGPLSSTEFFDPASGTFVTGPSMATRRQQLSVAANGNTAFVIGGAVSSAGGTPNSAYPTLLEQVGVTP